MIRLRTLGSVDLRALDGAQLHSVLRQPKRLAVLIYLAMSGPMFHRRDRLLALFWPESDEERARGALNQQIFHLRQALGKDVIVNRGDDDIGLAEGALWCDAAEFGELVKKGLPAEAMELYQGELLPGFLIDDAPEFERWLAEQRTRIATQAAAACLRISEQAAAAGQLAQAIESARRAISIQPLSEPNHQRLIELLDRSGDRAAALQAFEDLRDLLQSEFDAEPSAETLELHHAVRARAEAKSNGFRRAESAAPSSVHEPKRRREKARLAFAVASGALIIAALTWSALAVRKPKPYRLPADHIAVLYFNDESENKQLGYLAEGLTTTLIDQLGQVRKLQVISQNGVRPFRGHVVPLDSIARQLDVGTIVGGSVTRSNDRVRVTVELADGATGMVVRSKQLERPAGELFALLDDVAREVTSFLRFSLGEEIRLRERQAETRVVQAWELYQRAEYQRSYADSLDRSRDFAAVIAELERADSMLERASRLDKDWAAPLVLRGRIAERRAWMSMVTDRPPQHERWLALAQQYAEHALALDEASSAAYDLRGAIKFSAWTLGNAVIGASADTILLSAERDLKTALSINADLPRAESNLSAVMFVQGRFEEARQAARRALAADAYLTNVEEIAIRLFTTSFEVGDDVEAGHWCDEVRRRQPNQWPATYCDLVLLGWSTTGSPDPRKALLLLQNAASSDAGPIRASMHPRLMALTAAVLARAGQADSARAMLRQARAMAPTDPELLHLEAGVRVLLTERDQALALLRKYWRANPSAKPRIVNGRMFRPLRDEPEFRAATQTTAVTGSR
ncbi:MAG: BTAD domain-containing putative transcriptional regulator [Gemmatimonadota bacterium]